LNNRWAEIVEWNNLADAHAAMERIQRDPSLAGVVMAFMPQSRWLSGTMNSSSKRSAAVTAALDSLTGLGPKSTAMLAAVGVKSVTDLRKRGAAKAFFEVRAAGLRPSLNLLWALEGALTAMPWHKVARTERTRLLFEVEDLKAISAGGNRSGSGQ
jgi:DNA transformation protein